jgi:hypothetical protein
MVGSIHYKKERQNNLECAIQILETHPQIWYLCAKEHKGGLALDEEDNTTYWRDAVEKEMKNIRVAFEFNKKDEVPIAHAKVRCHWIYSTLKWQPFSGKQDWLPMAMKLKPQRYYLLFCGLKGLCTVVLPACSTQRCRDPEL